MIAHRSSNFSRATLAAFVAALIGNTLMQSTALAAAPQVETQAPGFYRMMLGDFEITALLDGTNGVEVDLRLTNVKPGQVETLLAREYLKSPVETSVNAFLINTGSKLVLVDTGAGSLSGPTLGKLLINLNAAGYKPGQIDDVLITHMHGDHIGGLTAAGQRTFPNAVVRMHKQEADYWLNLANTPADRKDDFQRAVTIFQPYIAAGKFQPFESDVEITPGIRAIAAHGHTPGHSLYAVESKGEKLVLWGDLLHVAAVQFPEPSITINFDTDSETARTQREKALAEAVSQGYWVGVAHISFPGLGHVRTDGDGYAWVPANYSAALKLRQ